MSSSDDNTDNIIKTFQLLSPSFDLHLTVVSGREMLGQEAVVAEQRTSLDIIFPVNKSRVALVAAEALVL